MRRRRVSRFFAWLVVLAVAAWAGGLWAFVRIIPSEVADPASETDAIVVLTGGSLRVESGLELLAQGKAKMLFVSGVYHGVEVSDLLRASRQAPDKIGCCIVLGHDAESTRGNALETAGFMQARNFHSLRLVTSSYHMPRSLLEFSRAMPGLLIVPNPVFPDLVREPRWWLNPQTLALVAGERRPRPGR